MLSTGWPAYQPTRAFPLRQRLRRERIGRASQPFRRAPREPDKQRLSPRPRNGGLPGLAYDPGTEAIGDDEPVFRRQRLLRKILRHRKIKAVAVLEILDPF